MKLTAIVGAFAVSILTGSIAAAVPCTAQKTRAAAPNGATIHAHIVGEARLPDGSPAEGALVSTEGASALADSGGFFSIPLTVPYGRAVTVTAATRFIGTNHRGSAGPVHIRSAQVDVGTITLARESVPLFFAPIGHRLTFSALGVLASADLDGDTDLDFLVNSFPNSFVVIRNGADGFEEAPALTDVRVEAFQPQDLDGDGDTDLVVSHVADGNGATCSAYLNDGEASFGARLPVGAVDGCSILTGDFDEDELPDVVLVAPGTLSFLRGLGDGTFAAPVASAAAVAPGAIPVVDFDADGDLDLAIAAGTTITIHLGNGNGGFASGASFGSGRTVTGLQSGDLDGDGVADLLATSSNGTAFLDPFFGDGNGAFVAGNSSSYATNGLSSITLAQVTGDGFADLILGEYSTGGDPVAWLRVRRGRGNGSFFSGVALPYARGMTRPVPLDFDADGALDVLYGIGEFGYVFQLEIHLNGGAIGFAYPGA